MSGNNFEGKGDDHLRKLFIGGLNIQTTDESLRAFYERFGEVVDCVVMKKETGQSKCFGFVSFSQSDMIDNCMATRPHHVDGKKVDPKRAMPKHDGNKSELHQSVKKVFVGGLRDLTENDIRNYFCSFGNIESIDIIIDKATGKNKGFCFITYDDTDSVDKIVLMKRHMINGVDVESKKAEEKRPPGAMAGTKRSNNGLPLGRGPMQRNASMAYPGQQNYPVNNFMPYTANYGTPMNMGGPWNGGWNQTVDNGFQYAQTNSVESARNVKQARGSGGPYNNPVNNSSTNRRASAPYDNQSSASVNFSNTYYGHM